MVFNDITLLQGIVQDVDFGVNSNIVSYPIEHKTRSANRALDRATQIIVAARNDGTWQFGDRNSTSLLIASADLVSGQQDYELDSTFLTLEYLYILDSSNTKILLDPIDQNDLTGGALIDTYGVSGVPNQYDKQGDSILLDPIPNYSKTAGLIAHFQTKIDYFLTTDTIKEPGFAPHLHRYVSLWMQYDYALAKLGSTAQGQKKINQLRAEITAMEADIKKYYAFRAKDERGGLTGLPIMHK